MKQVKRASLIFFCTVAVIIGVTCYIIMIATSFPSSQSNTHAAHFLQELKNGAPKRPLTELTDFAWDKVCFIAPYTAQEAITHLIGEDYALEQIDTSNDGVFYLVFALPDQGTLVIPIPRSIYDPPTPQPCLPYAEARYLIF